MVEQMETEDVEEEKVVARTNIMWKADGGLKWLDFAMRRKKAGRIVSYRGLFDTGCSKTLTSSNLESKLGLEIKESLVKLVNVSGDEMKVEGTAK